MYQNSQIFFQLSEIQTFIKQKIKEILAGKISTLSTVTQTDLIYKNISLLAEMSKLNICFFSILQQFMKSIASFTSRLMPVIPINKVQLRVILKKISTTAKSQLTLQNCIRKLCSIVETIVGEKMGYQKNSSDNVQNNFNTIESNISQYKNQKNAVNLKEGYYIANYLYGNLGIDSYNIAIISRKYQQNGKEQIEEQMLQRNRQIFRSISYFSKCLKRRHLKKAEGIHKHSSFSDNQIIWQMRTNSFIQSNLMKRTNQTLKRNVLSARSFVSQVTHTIQCQEKPSSKKQKSFYKVGSLRKNIDQCANMRLVTIDSLPRQNFKQINIKKRKFYKKSVQQQQLLKYRTLTERCNDIKKIKQSPFSTISNK